MEEHLEEEAANQPFTTYFCQRKFFETRLRHGRKVLNKGFKQSKYHKKIFDFAVGNTAKVFLNRVGKGC